MADDPRIEPLARAILDGPMECLGAGGDLLATAHTALTAADAHDPLRALLADEDRALEVMAAASWESWKADGTKWADQSEWYRAKWLTLQQSEYIAVLAVLREVAGL